MSSGLDTGKADPAGSGATDGGDRNLSLMGGIARAEVPGADDVEFLDGPKTKPQLSHGTMLILGVVGFAALSIFLMRLTTRGDTVSAVTAEMQAHIEEALSKIQSKDMAPNDPLAPNNVNNLFKDVDSIVGFIGQDPTIHQVPIEYIQKNPFELPQVKAGELTVTSLRPDDTSKKLEAEFRTLRLKSIASTGSRTIALINDQMVQTGGKLGSFLVADITPTKVVLTGAGKTYALEMDDTIKTRGH